MPLSHTTKLFGVEDAKIAKVLTDPAGAPTTYAALVDVPGITGITIGGEITNAELRGDNTLLDSSSVLSSITISLEYSKLNFDALAVMLGGAVVDSGTTPNMVATYDRLGTDAFNYFKLEVKTPTNGVDPIGGDGHWVFAKCILSEFPEVGMAGEDYQTFSTACKALVPLGTPARWLRFVENETAAAIV